MLIADFSAIHGLKTNGATDEEVETHIRKTEEDIGKLSMRACCKTVGHPINKKGGTYGT
jgi:hypothetical protein